MEQDDPLMAGEIPPRDREVRLLLESGRVGEASTAFDQLVGSVPNEVGEDWDRAIVLVHRSLLAWRLSRIPLALELAAEGWTELDAESPRGPAAAQTIGMLGYLLESLGHRRAALDMMRTAVQVARGAGDHNALAHCLQRLSGALLFRAAAAGDVADTESGTALSEARELIEEGLPIAHEGGVRRALLGGYARTLIEAGEFERAEGTALQASEASTAADDRWNTALANWVLAAVYRARGRLDEARTHASRAVLDAERINDAMLLMRFSLDLSTICDELGDSVGESAALRRTVIAGFTAVQALQEGLGQALEQRKVAVQAQRLAVAAQEAAARDPLTGLVNRLGLERAAPRLLEQTASRGRVPWLVLVDVDWFKGVNDDAGHPAGDSALREIAQMLRGECRADDLVCRWAGDEFVVLLVDTTESSREAGPLVAERIRASVDSHDWRLVLGPTRQPPTVSIGVAAGPAQLDQLFAAADIALYRAKRAGRNRVEVQPSDSDEQELAGKFDSSPANENV